MTRRLARPESNAFRRRRSFPARKGHDMNRTGYFRAAAGAVAIAALACASGAAYAATTSTASVVTGPDHQRLTFTLAPGASHTFTLPKANDPIRIDIAKPSTNGGLQEPSEVFSALVNVDGNGVGMTWVGTNSDGTQTGSNSFNGTDITNLVCGSNCLIASLNVGNPTARTVVLSTNAATSTIDETYVVNIWY
jgi:hypothetical protein